MAVPWGLPLAQPLLPTPEPRGASGVTAVPSRTSAATPLACSVLPIAAAGQPARGPGPPLRCSPRRPRVSSC
eukprot:4546998-Prymnesium_polylepis.1